MRYLSICSGIEAASVAWGPLGWKPAAFAEIDKFPSAVLKHRYPTVRNLGDVQGIKVDKAANALYSVDLASGERSNTPVIDLDIDVVVAGFPCQDLSVAGQRKGLKNDDGTTTRSGLFFSIADLADAIGQRWTVLENVPGLLSSNEGRDFREVVGTLSGSTFDVPRSGWANAGVCVGPKGLVEWFVLDAQYVRVESHPRAVPQRRRRVFIVRDSGNWQHRPPLLFERESMCGHPPPSRKAGQDVAGSLASHTSAGGGLGTDFDLAGGVVSHSLNAKGGTGRIDAESETFVAGTLRRDHSNSGNHEQLVASTLAASDGGVSSGMHPVVAHSLRGEGFDASEDGTGRGTPLVAFNARQDPNVSGNVTQPLNADGTSVAVAFGFENRSRGDDGRGYDRPPHFAEEVGPTVGTVKEPSVAGATVRRLTPKECERLQGFPDDYTLVPYRGKDARDGLRYKAIGNSMAVNVMSWIGQRIDAVNQSEQKRQTCRF